MTRSWYHATQYYAWQSLPWAALILSSCWCELKRRSVLKAAIQGRCMLFLDSLPRPAQACLNTASFWRASTSGNDSSLAVCCCQDRRALLLLAWIFSHPFRNDLETLKWYNAQR